MTGRRPTPPWSRTARPHAQRGLTMGNLRKSFAAALVLAGLTFTSTSAAAGSSFCSLSGRDDRGGVQSFGQNMADGWYKEGSQWSEPFILPVEPEDDFDGSAYEDVVEEEFGNPGGLVGIQFYPGWACNPTVFDDRP